MRKRTQGINVRVTAAEKCKIERSAAGCGLTVSEYLRRRALGYTPKFHPPPELFSALTYMDNLTDMLERLDSYLGGQYRLCAEGSATVCFVEVKTVSELAPVHWFCPVYVWNIDVRTSHTNHLRTPGGGEKSMPEIPGTSVPFCGRKKRVRRHGNQKHRSLFLPHPLTLFTGWKNKYTGWKVYSQPFPTTDIFPAGNVTME